MGYIWQRWLADELRAAGLKVREVDGWRNRGRPASTGGFNPGGPTMHHTGTHSTASNPHPTLSTVIQGRNDLHGPLCQVLVAYDGTLWIIAAGRANHAGTNNGYGPYAYGDGNSQSVGFEIDYDGTQPIPPAAKQAAVGAGAVVLDHYDHPEAWAVTHKETSTTGKWDTGGVPGSQWRQWISEWTGEDDDMPISDDDAEKIARAVWAHMLAKWEPGQADDDEKMKAGQQLGQARGWAKAAK